MLQMKKMTSAVVLAGMLALGFSVAAPAEAQQTGLVNVSVDNNQILNNVSVQVAANLAAQRLTWRSTRHRAGAAITPP